METVLLYVLGILIIVVGLALSVGLHELGHFLPAKLFGVRVSQFFVGFGRTLWSKRRGETEYGVKMLPIGGFVAMSGMYPPLKPGGAARTASTGLFQTLVQDARNLSAETIPEGEEHRAFYRLPAWKRIVVMLGGPAMNVLLAVLFYAVLILGFGVPQLSTTISRVDQCVVPAGTVRESCLASDPAAPAAEAGVLPGDSVVSFAGTEINSWEQLSALIRDRAGEQTPITVQRGAEQLQLNVTPLATERYVLDDAGKVQEDAAGKPVTETVGFLGIGSRYERVPGDVSDVLPAVGSNIAAVTGIIVNLPQRLVAIAQAAFGTEERDPNGPLSVVGVGRLAGEVLSSDLLSVQERAASMFGILASLNVALAIFNLVPLFPLDGGHVVAAIYEKVRRIIARIFRRSDPGPVDVAKMMPVTFAVVIFFVAMTVLLVYADIVKPINFFG